MICQKDDTSLKIVSTSNFQGLVTENQQNVTFLMKQTADMIHLMTSKNPGINFKLKARQTKIIHT
jgi:hypothetical protein